MTAPTGPGVAVVGTGFGCFTHVRALRHAGFDVRWLIGRDAARTRARATMFGVERHSPSLAEALADDAVAAVTIATPPDSHAALAHTAIAAGRHVLCEKPFTTSTADAVAVLAAAQDAGVVHILGTEFRYDAGQALLADAVRAGRIGVPRIATWLMHVPVLVDPAAEIPRWWRDAGAGGGWLFAHGSQVIDQIRVTAGEFAGVSASVFQTIDRPGMNADDAFVIHFRLVNGCVGTLQSSAADRGLMIETRVTGTAGTAWIEGVGSTVRVATAAGVERIVVPPELAPLDVPPLPDGAVESTYDQMITMGVEYGPYTRLAAAFRDAIEQRPPSIAGRAPATFADGVAQMRVLDAVRQSSAGGGRWVDTGGGEG